MTQSEMAVKMVLDRWNGSIVNTNKLLKEITDEQLMNEVAPGKNRGVYLLGHLIAVHDDMLILLGMGEKLFPELFELFIKQADKANAMIPTSAELRAMWDKQNVVLQAKFAAEADWYAKHTAVSAEDFVKEPHRNKLNIIITRTSHLQYHSGQLALLK
ncbi:MAG: DinB family protein [Bacteroidia bacterium]|nr:DinB family protein [Bacteroidia bacterium]